MKRKVKLVGNLLTVTFEGRTNGSNGLANRGCVDSFSRSSRARMCGYLRGAMADYKYFTTLTYPENAETWFGFKDHFRAFIERARRAGYIHESTSWFWFLEFQSRGAPHFHIFSTSPIGKHWLSKNWFECVGSGDRKHLAAGTNTCKWSGGTAAARVYAAKYAKKSEQKEVPDLFKNPQNYGFDNIEQKKLKIGRFWGIAGQRNVMAAATSLEPSAGNTEKEIFLQNQLVKVINHAICFDRVKIWHFDVTDCYEFKDYRTQCKIYDILNKLHEEKLWRLGVTTSRIVQESARLRLAMSVESRAQLYKTASQEGIYNERLLDAYLMRK